MESVLGLYAWIDGPWGSDVSVESILVFYGTLLSDSCPGACVIWLLDRVWGHLGSDDCLEMASPVQFYL